MKTFFETGNNSFIPCTSKTKFMIASSGFSRNHEQCNHSALILYSHRPFNVIQILDLAWILQLQETFICLYYTSKNFAKKVKIRFSNCVKSDKNSVVSITLCILLSWFCTELKYFFPLDCRKIASKIMWRWNRLQKCLYIDENIAVLAFLFMQHFMPSCIFKVLFPLSCHSNFMKEQFNSIYVYLYLCTHHQYSK